MVLEKLKETKELPESFNIGEENTFDEGFQILNLQLIYHQIIVMKNKLKKEDSDDDEIDLDKNII